MSVGTGVSVGFGVGVSVGIGVSVGTGVSVGSGVLIGTSVGCVVSVGWGVMVASGVEPPHAETAVTKLRARAMSRFFFRISCSLASVGHLRSAHKAA